jgi:rhamnulokinase
VRCVLESLALEYQRVLGGLEEINKTGIETIHIVGGGSRNDLLNQFTANACGRRVLAGPVEATTLGNLLIQARACGEVGSLGEVRSIAGRSCELREFTPESSDAAVWQEAKGRFEKLRK